MSVDIPKVTIAFGSVSPSQGDVVDLRVHLGCTKEVSSFELTLQNWNKKYSPGGTSPINVGMDGHMDVGRGSNVPQIITCRVESTKCKTPTPNEHYITVSGRCWGEKLFRRVVTKTYTNQKGEAIAKDLMDSFAGLSHTRNSTELVENTDTTFTSLEYENTPLWDILKYVAESSDKAGVIGYDFRVAPDGKFEFFPKNSKTSPVALTEKLEVSEYRKDIFRIRNRIMVYGLADKSVPLDKDSWTESLNPSDGSWSAPSGVVSFDTSTKVTGSGSIKCYNVQAYYVSCMLTLNAGKEVNANLYPALSFYVALQKAFSGDVGVALYDIANKEAWKHITIAPGEWRKTDLKVGLANELEWDTVQLGFDWSQIKKVRVDFWFAGVGEGSAWIDALYFGGRRYAAVREDAASQTVYGLRELTETDEELVSDNECDLRAKALLDYFKSPAEYLTASSTVIDYGATPLLPGDKIPVALPNENVDTDFCIESVEYHVDAKVQTLEIALELGKGPPQLADYLYGLRATTVTVEKLARTKLGKKGIPSVTYGGGLGSHHVGHEAGDESGAQWATDQDGGWDKIAGWVSPKFIGPFDNSAAVIKFRTKNKAGSSPLDHQFVPSDDLHGVLGSESYRWKEIHSLYAFLYDSLRLKTAGDANAKALLDLVSLQFGPGGGSAPDTHIKRIAQGFIELKDHLVPPSDNAGYIGTDVTRWKELHATGIWAILHSTGDLLPNMDNYYSIGTADIRFLDLYLSGAIKSLVGGVAVHLLPNVSGTYDLGSTAKKWSNVYSNGLTEVGWLNVGSFTVISSGRVLQNVTADALIISTGRFGFGRLPEGAGGCVLEAEGSGFDPMYVDPNGRYTPKNHDHAGQTISPSAVNCNTMSIAVSCNRQYAHPSSQQCVYASSIAWEHCPHFSCKNYSA